MLTIRVVPENKREMNHWFSFLCKSDEVQSVFKFLVAVGVTISQLFE
jgi:hypothetical protein